MDFYDLYICRKSSLLIKKGNNSLLKCWFSGKFETKDKNNDYIHFVTFSTKCFFDDNNQNLISIMVNPEAKLPEWKILKHKNIEDIKDSIEHDLDLELGEENNPYSKIGGKPHYINSGQAYQFERIVEQNNLDFIMQLSEEDFFPIETPNIDKRIRDCLCGGTIYIFAKIDKENKLVDFSNTLIDHHV
jgi:hypothetical protein